MTCIRPRRDLAEKAAGDTALTHSSRTSTLMLDDPSLPVYLTGGAVVALLVALRIHAGEQYFNDRGRAWWPLRRTLVPALHRLFQSADEGLYAETTISEDELVAVLSLPPEAVLDDLAEAGYEPQPLASFATDWAGRSERASWARYYGPKPVDVAPDWLRPRQIHVRLFVDEDATGGPVTIVTAHEEATAWRPDLWLDHYRAATLDVELGRQLVAEDLAIDLQDSRDAERNQDHE